MKNDLSQKRIRKESAGFLLNQEKYIKDIKDVGNDSDASKGTDCPTPKS